MLKQANAKVDETKTTKVVEESRLLEFETEICHCQKYRILPRKLGRRIGRGFKRSYF